VNSNTYNKTTPNGIEQFIVNTTRRPQIRYTAETPTRVSSNSVLANLFAVCLWCLQRFFGHRVSWECLYFTGVTSNGNGQIVLDIPKIIEKKFLLSCL